MAEAKYIGGQRICDLTARERLDQMDGRLDQYEGVFTGDVDESVQNWLDEHPEATTTVQDGSLTEAKFTDALKLKTINEYVTPEMYGAKGDGTTDDTTALQSALGSGKVVHLGKKTYATKNLTFTNNETVLEGEGQNCSKLLFIGTGECIRISNAGFKSIIKDLAVVASNTADSTGIGIHASNDIQVGNARVNLYHVSVSGFGECGIKYRSYVSGSYLFEGELNGIKVSNCGIGMWLGFVDSNVSNVLIDRCKQEGLVIASANTRYTNVKVCMCDISDRTLSGIKLSGSRNQLSAVETQENMGTGIFVEGNSNLIDICLDGNGTNDFDRQETPDLLYPGMYITGANNRINAVICDFSGVNQVRGIIEELSAHGNVITTAGMNKKEDYILGTDKADVKSSSILEAKYVNYIYDGTYTDTSDPITYDSDDGALLIKKNYGIAIDLSSVDSNLKYYTVNIDMVNGCAHYCNALYIGTESFIVSTNQFAHINSQGGQSWFKKFTDRGVFSTTKFVRQSDGDALLKCYMKAMPNGSQEGTKNFELTDPNAGNPEHIVIGLAGSAVTTDDYFKIYRITVSEALTFEDSLDLMVSDVKKHKTLLDVTFNNGVTYN